MNTYTNRSADSWTSSKGFQQVTDPMICEELCREEALERDHSIGNEQQQSPTERVLHDDDNPPHEYAFHGPAYDSWISNYIDPTDTGTDHTALHIATDITEYKIHAPNHGTISITKTTRYEEAELETKQKTPIPSNMRNRPQRLPVNR